MKNIYFDKNALKALNAFFFLRRIGDLLAFSLPWASFSRNSSIYYHSIILSTIILSSNDHSIFINFSQNFNVTYPTAYSPQHCLVLMIEKMSEILWLWKRCNRCHYRTILRLRLLWSRTPYCKTQCIQARYNYLDLFYSYLDKKEARESEKFNTWATSIS